MANKTKKQLMEEQALEQKINEYLEYYANTLRQFGLRYGISVSEFCVVGLSTAASNKSYFAVNGVKYVAFSTCGYNQKQIEIDVNILSSLSKLIPSDTSVNTSQARYYKAWQ